MAQNEPFLMAPSDRNDWHKTNRFIQTSKTQKNDPRKELYGSLKLNESADEFITGIKKDRNFTCKTVYL